MVNGIATEYAQLLSPCEHKGKLDLEEKEESKATLSLKLHKLAEFIRESRYTVVHTGAGISTKAGIADFRGPCGLWTLEGKNQLATSSISFEEALPTVAHVAIAQLCQEKLVKFVVTQNVDGLHRKSGVPEQLLAEIHGCLFVGYCIKCNKKQVLDKPTNSVGFRNIPIPCSSCNEPLCDFVLDWYDELPKVDLERAISHSRKADLHIVIGSSLQMLPSKNFCLMSLGNGGKLIILNLSETSQDSKATMIIRGDSERCLSALLFLLQLPVVLWVPKQIVQVGNRINYQNMKDRMDEWDSTWLLKVDCSAFPRNPCLIQPKQVERHTLCSSINWTWNDFVLEVWIVSASIPSVSITFHVFFPQLPCCCFSIRHSFSPDAFMNQCFFESFQLSYIPSLKDIIEGFHLAYESICRKTMKEDMCTSPEHFFYKCAIQRRYQICLLCEKKVYCTSRKRHLKERHYAKRH